METQTKTSQKKKLYVVEYNSDPHLIVDDHLSDILFLTGTSKKGFIRLIDALTFLSECVSPITTVYDLIPELKGKVNFDYLLPENHIRPKHQLMSMSDMEEKFTNFDGIWSRI